MSVPAMVKSGDSVMLFCHYDLEGAPLYTMQWYLGEHEFYRYVPKKLPPKISHPVPGIEIDVSNIFFLFSKNVFSSPPPPPTVAIFFLNCFNFSIRTSDKQDYFLTKDYVSTTGGQKYKRHPRWCPEKDNFFKFDLRSFDSNFCYIAKY